MATPVKISTVKSLKALFILRKINICAPLVRQARFAQLYHTFANEGKKNKELRMND
jgi:hypothetical protein